MSLSASSAPVPAALLCSPLPLSPHLCVHPQLGRQHPTPSRTQGPQLSTCRTGRRVRLERALDAGRGSSSLAGSVGAGISASPAGSSEATHTVRQARQACPCPVPPASPSLVSQRCSLRSLAGHVLSIQLLILSFSYFLKLLAQQQQGKSDPPGGLLGEPQAATGPPPGAGCLAAGCADHAFLCGKAPPCCAGGPNLLPSGRPKS